MVYYTVTNDYSTDAQREVKTMAMEALQATGSNVVAMPTIKAVQPTVSPTTEKDFKPSTGEGTGANIQTATPTQTQSPTQAVIASEVGAADNAREVIKDYEAENEKIRMAMSELNKKITKNSEAVFGVHDGTNRITIKIVDKDSKEVIKELPPEKTLDMIAKVWELAGMMVDEKR